MAHLVYLNTSGGVVPASKAAQRALGGVFFSEKQLEAAERRAAINAAAEVVISIAKAAGVSVPRSFRYFFKGVKYRAWIHAYYKGELGMPADPVYRDDDVVYVVLPYR